MNKISRILLPLTVFVSFLSPAHPAAAAHETQPAQNMVHILDYISVDYPSVVENGRVIDAQEYEEQREFAARLQGLTNRLPATHDTTTMQAMVQTLVDAIDHKAPGEQINRQAKALTRMLILAYDIHLAPAQAPNLNKAQTLFETHCSACHGATGQGDGPMAVGLEPPPADFHDLARQSQRSLYSLYSTISLGVEGTAMPAFDLLEQDERWALAFYVSRFSASGESVRQGHQIWEQGTFRNVFPDLASITSVSPAQLAPENDAPARAVLAYLRANPGALGGATENTSPPQVAVQKLQQSVDEYRNGQREAAHDSAVAAYLQGFELMENSLGMVDQDLRLSIEVKMGHYRKSIQEGGEVEDIAAQEAELESLLHTASKLMETDTLSPLMGAFSAFILLLREGLEAILVLAAIIAFLTKSERRDALPYVHAGWIGALFLGLLTWIAASYFIDIGGEDRELTEGITALVAAAMLVYMGYWLHSNASAQRWQEFIHDKLHGALKGNPVWAMVAISFIAVYREMFETILFYQTLWLQMQPGDRIYLLLGIASAVAVLLALAWALFRYSMRLPFKQFFTVNAVLLYALAVIFAGKGIHALQEAAVVSSNPVNFPRLDLLGIYPSIETLAAQLLLLALAAAWLVYGRYQLNRNR
jgi:high-affinity iron transporter